MTRFYAAVLSVVFAVLCLPALTLAQQAQMFVPKKGAAVTDLAIVLEWHPIGRQTESVAAKRLSAELTKQLGFAFRKLATGDRILFRGYCQIILRDWSLGEPNFQIGCRLLDGSNPPFERLPETPEEVVKELKDWMAQYKTYPEKVYPERPQLELEPMPVHQPRPHHRLLT